MANIKEALATSASVSCTLASLADGSARQSASVDNSSNLYTDALVTVTVTLASGTPASDKAVYVYAAGSEDGTNFTDNASGSDAAITLRSPTNLRLIGVFSTPDSGGLTYVGGPFSVAKVFDGILPRKWSVVAQNKTGLALAGSGNSITYSGVFLTSA